MTNKAAQALGRLAAGKPKNYSADELERRRKRMTKMNKAKHKLKPRQPRKG